MLVLPPIENNSAAKSSTIIEELKRLVNHRLLKISNFIRRHSYALLIAAAWRWLVFF